MSLQPLEELEKFYNAEDPWGYEENPSDKNRKALLLNELSILEKPKRVLDIGCGHGFITRDLPGEKIIGVDISEGAIEQAKKISRRPHVDYQTIDMYDLSREKLTSSKGFDLIIITGVMYPQYIEKSKTAIYQIIDKLLASNGFLVSVHINEWYTSRFPYVLLRTLTYEYREYQHYMEVYKKI